MATLYTDVAAKQLDTVNKRQPGLQVTGNLCMAVAKYIIKAGAAAADLIRVVKLPPGAMVIPHLCQVVAEDPGTAMNLTGIGDDLGTPDPDKYSGAIDLSAGGQFPFVAGAAVGALSPTPLTDEAWITATLGTVTALTVDQEVVFYIAYSAVS